MPMPKEFSKIDVNYIVHQFQSKLKNQQELAYEFGVSPVTIRRILAEKGILELVGYKTDKDSNLLNYLKLHGLYDLSKLKGRIHATKHKSIKAP